MQRVLQVRRGEHGTSKAVGVDRREVQGLSPGLPNIRRSGIGKKAARRLRSRWGMGQWRAGGSHALETK